MDGIQPNVGASRPPGLPAAPVSPTPSKAPSDYLRALRRRIGLILAVGVPLSLAAAVFAVRQPAIYQARAEIMIEPPAYDPVLTTLVSHEIGHRDPEAQEKYVPNRAAQLRSRQLAEIVVKDPSVARPGVPEDEAAQELITGIQTRQIPNSNHFQVTLEGTDPARTARMLYTLLDAFQKMAGDEIQDKVEASKVHASMSLDKLKQELAALDRNIDTMLKTTKTIGPGGKSLPEEQYLTYIAMLTEKKRRLGEIRQQALIAQYFPSARAQFGGSPNEGLVAELERKREELTGKMHLYKRQIRPNYFNTDPSVRFTRDKLALVTERLNRLRSAPAEAGGDPTEAVISNMRAEIQADEGATKALLKELQESMPEHQRFLTMLEERKQKVERIATMQEKLSDFDILSKSQKNPISIPM
ncbi:MAG TPA: hypothetical protein VKP69_15790, partial [Isosphaeraceae bacterium]|nr:hypothetical protein [Isosphaeraceae bacterium]